MRSRVERGRRRAGATRLLLVTGAASLLILAVVRSPAVSGGQAAVSLSRPGHEDLTFWVNHNGLSELDIEGEVGFGDLGRILMRRRANAEAMRKLRDRFVFNVRDPREIRTADVFRVELSEAGLVWRNQPRQFVLAAGRTFNLPLIVENATGRTAPVEVRFEGSAASAVGPSEIAAQRASAYFLKVVESSAGPASGRLVVRSGDRRIESALALDVRPLGKLRVILVDEDGRPARARVYLTASDGLAYAPIGSISRIAAMGAEYYFHAADNFQVDLPAGPALIEATRGQEYELSSLRVEVKPGTTTVGEIRLKRWENLAARGWYSADAHIHANYTAEHHQVITPEDVRLQTLAEDLNNANLMVANSSGAFIHDQQFFEGRPHQLSRPNYLMYWNEEMRNSGLYGHMSFFNLKSLVRPIYTGFRDTPHWEDYPANYAQAAEAERQGGAVTYVHPGYGANLEQASARELPVDLALGSVDAMDVVSNNPEPVGMELWYRLLNCGFRIGISAGTDSFTNVADHYLPGGGRVYVHTAGSLRYEEWIRNYKRGRSFATNGPVVLLTVNGVQPGDEVKLPAGPQRVRVQATLRTLVPVDAFEVVVNGRAVISRSAGGQKTLEIDEEIAVDRSAWIAARATGPWHRLIVNDLETFSHTSPVYVYLGSQTIAARSDIRFYIDWIERLIARTAERGRFATPERKQEVLDLFRRALEVYRQREAAAPPG